MRLGPSLLLLLAVVSLTRCDELIKPDPRARGWHDPHSHSLSLVDLNSPGIGPNSDQGDERPLIMGRSYVIAWVCKTDRDRAYELKGLLLDKGLDVVVGLQAGHGTYFIRSRKGYDWIDPMDRREAEKMIDDLGPALLAIQQTNPGVLQGSVRDNPPYALEARRP